ncbi:MAG: hypothetical protein MMC23_004873 [Stictis urceolatum]|nr:hypothetical protein [Stictis urceolata]
MAGFLGRSAISRRNSFAGDSDNVNRTPGQNSQIEITSSSFTDIPLTDFDQVSPSSRSSAAHDAPTTTTATAFSPRTIQIRPEPVSRIRFQNPFPGLSELFAIEPYSTLYRRAS